MSFENIKDALWVVRSFVIVQEETEEETKLKSVYTGFGGGICIHPEGLIMTTYVAACPSTVFQDIVVDDPKMFVVTAASSRFQEFREMSLVSRHPLEGVLVFKVSSAKDEVFSYIDLNVGGDGVRINEGYSLSCLTHEGKYGLLYSVMYGKANFVYDPTQNDHPVGEDRVFGSLSDDDYTELKDSVTQLNPSVRTVGWVVDLSGSVDDDAVKCAIQAAEAHEANQPFDRIPESYMMHADLPLIQMSGFGPSSYNGQSGCPIYGTEDSSFLGMMIFAKGIYTFALPKKVLRHCLGTILERYSRYKKKLRESSSGASGSSGGGGAHGRGRRKRKRNGSKEKTLSQPQLSQQGRVLEAAIEAAASAIIDLKDNLNDWDSKSGDGDFGSTMCRCATIILEDLKKHYPLNDAAETINEIGSSIRRVIGGTSGIMYDIFSKAAYAHLKAKSESVVTPLSWADALESAIAAISKYGGASAGYHTMLDALMPAASVLKERLTIGDDPVDCFVLSSVAALSGAEATKNMQVQAGRSSYVPGEILASNPDPGAMAAAAWFRAAALAVKKME